MEILEMFLRVFCFPKSRINENSDNNPASYYQEYLNFWIPGFLRKDFENVGYQYTESNYGGPLGRRLEWVAWKWG